MTTRLPLYPAVVLAAAMVLALSLAAPERAVAQNYGAMMPEALQREYKRASVELTDLKERLEAVDEEILAIDLQDPDAKEPADDSPLFEKRKELLAKQADIVRQALAKEAEANRLESLLKEKRLEYRSVD